MRDKVYLIGQISMHSNETYLWRRRVKEYMKGNEQFEFIDPCDNEFNKSIVGDPRLENDKNRVQVYKSEGIGLIVPKDKMYVAKSTIAIANMNHYDTDKPMIGTCFELAWYHTNNHKAVIGIFDGEPEESVYAWHPFIRSSVNAWVRNEIEACELMKEYFSW